MTTVIFFLFHTTYQTQDLTCALHLSYNLILSEKGSLVVWWEMSICHRAGHLEKVPFNLSYGFFYRNGW